MRNMFKTNGAVVHSEGSETDATVKFSVAVCYGVLSEHKILAIKNHTGVNGVNTFYSPVDFIITAFIFVKVMCTQFKTAHSPKCI